MKGRTVFPIVVGAIALAMAIAPVRGEDSGDPRPLSQAQIALFERDHFRDIHQAEQLEYRFRHEEHRGKEAADYVDRVALDLRPRDDGSKDVSVDFLTGEHHVPFPSLTEFHGNPVLMFFLERDVIEMHRATGGSAAYFRNSIRRAFVDQAVVKPIELQRDGKPVSGTEITLAPFKQDPQIAAFPGLKDKLYRFLLSDSVPGEVYEIGSQVPGEAGEPPRMEESMTLAGVRPCETEEGPCSPPAPH